MRILIQWVPVMVVAFGTLVNGHQPAQAPTPVKDIKVTNVAILEGHKDSATTIDFSPDGKTLVTTDWAGKARLWDIPTGRLRFSLERAGSARNAFSPDGKILATITGEGLLKLWEASSGRELTSFKPEHKFSALTDLKFSPDGTRLALGTIDGLFTMTGTVLLWDVAKAKVIDSLKVSAGPVYAVDFSPDGKTLAVGTGDGRPYYAARSGTLMLLEVSPLKVRRSLRKFESWVTVVKFSPAGKLLATASANTVKLWDPATLREQVTLKGQGPYVAFAPDGRLLATATSLLGGIKIWDLPNGRELENLSKKFTGMGPIAFSPDGNFLAAADAGGVVRLWKLESAK